MTNYDKWNKVSMEELGWEQEDEESEKGPELRKLEAMAENEKKLEDARRALHEAKMHQRRAQQLSEDLLKQKTVMDKQLWWLIMVIVGAGLALVGLVYTLVDDNSSSSSSSASASSKLKTIESLKSQMADLEKQFPLET